MKTNRREFLYQASVLTGAATLSSLTGLAQPANTHLTGVQLYSVRDDMWKDPAGTLKKLAQIGYRYVEHAGYQNGKFYGYSAKEFKDRLNDLGMKMPSGHTVLDEKHYNASTGTFSDDWKKLVEDAATVGQQFVISPSMSSVVRKDLDQLKRFMDIFNQCGTLCKSYGMKFGYHNHHFEFNEFLGDKSLYDHILSNTDPELVMQQLDIGNLFNGGAVALDIAKKWPGRFQSMHVKDEILAKEGHEKYESTILGKGIVQVKEVIDIGKKYGGTIHFIVEQESYQGISPMECMRIDLDIMKGWGY
jgi:sugar phosphate isomerase/epimerase